MNCKNCGNPLAPGMQFCISCGKAVEEASPVTPSTPVSAPPVEPPVTAPQAEVLTTVPSEPVTPAPAEEPLPPIAPEATVQPPVAPVSPVVEPVAPVVNTTPTVSPTPNQPQANNKTLIIVIVAFVVLIIGLVGTYFLFLRNTDTKDETSAKKEKQETVTPVVVNDPNVITFNNYEFTLPAGYKSEIDEDGDLVIYDASEKWGCYTFFEENANYDTYLTNIATLTANMTTNGALNVVGQEVTIGEVKVIKVTYEINSTSRTLIIQPLGTAQVIVTDFADFGGLSDDVLTDVVEMLASAQEKRVIFTKNNLKGNNIIKSIIN